MQTNKIWNLFILCKTTTRSCREGVVRCERPPEKESLLNFQKKILFNRIMSKTPSPSIDTLSKILVTPMTARKSSRELFLSIDVGWVHAAKFQSLFEARISWSSFQDSNSHAFYRGPRQPNIHPHYTFFDLFHNNSTTIIWLKLWRQMKKKLNFGQESRLETKLHVQVHAMHGDWKLILQRRVQFAGSDGKWSTSINAPPPPHWVRLRITAISIA